MNQKHKAEKALCKHIYIECFTDHRHRLAENRIYLYSYLQKGNMISRVNGGPICMPGQRQRPASFWCDFWFGEGFQ